MQGCTSSLRFDARGDDAHANGKRSGCRRFVIDQARAGEVLPTFCDERRSTLFYSSLDPLIRGFAGHRKIPSRKTVVCPLLFETCPYRP